jgi:hypothetical protein
MAIDFHGWNSQIPVAPSPQLGQPSGLVNMMPQQHNIPADSFYDSSVDLEQIIRTGAVASSNRDSPFLSASEAHWLFNNEGQRMVSHSQSNQGSDEAGPSSQAYMDPLPAFQAAGEGQPHLPRSMSWPALNDRKTAIPKNVPYLAPLVPPVPKQIIFTPLAREKLLRYLDVGLSR